ncbi:MAG: hypothetical protein R3C08_09705 [Hyphomonas sp.]
MSTEYTTSDYPGDSAEPSALISLADEYRESAILLMSRGRRGAPLSWAPARLVAIHAIELYLNAFLIKAGYTPADIRGLQHDFDRRTAYALDAGLTLRRRTAAHLNSLHANREYLGARYGPEQANTWSQLNRLLATLEEVSSKVTETIR